MILELFSVFFSNHFLIIVYFKRLEHRGQLAGDAIMDVCIIWRWVPVQVHILGLLRESYIVVLVVLLCKF